MYRKFLFRVLWFCVLSSCLGFAEDVTSQSEKGFRLKTNKKIDWFTGKFSHENTQLVYLSPLNRPDGIGHLEAPENIQKGYCKGRFLPWGYGSGIEDVNLYTGQLLVALRGAYIKTKDPDLARYLKYYFQGIRNSASVSKVKGFVSRGPHPDGKSYYTDPSRDQVSSHIYGLWAYFRSGVATDEEKRFIKNRIEDVFERLEGDNWVVLREDGVTKAHAGESWLTEETHAATTLLPALAMAYDITGNMKWLDSYKKFSPVMWPHLNPAEKFKFRGHPLYIYQQLYKLIVFQELVEKIEPDKMDVVVNCRLAWATSMTNLDWPWGKTKWDPEDMKALGWEASPENAFEACDLIKPEYFDGEYRRKNGVAGGPYRLVMSTSRFSAVNLLAGCLSGDAGLTQKSEGYMQDLFGKINPETFENSTIPLVEILYRLQKISGQ